MVKDKEKIDDQKKYLWKVHHRELVRVEASMESRKEWFC
jgi:hypothetical protein